MLDFTFVGIYIQMLCCEDQLNRDLFLGADSLEGCRHVFDHLVDIEYFPVEKQVIGVEFI